MPYCPACGGEFVDRVTHCPDCSIPLTHAIGDGGAGSGRSERPIWPVVIESGDPAALTIAKSVLDGAGIEHVSEGEALQDVEGAGRLGTGFNVVLGPARLRVPPDRASEARALLIEAAPAEGADWVESIPPEPPPEVDAAWSETPRRSAGGRGRFLAGLAAGALLGFFAPQLLQRDGDGPFTFAVMDDVVSEDTDGDGEPDTWTTYRGSRPVSMERDRNGDGRLDNWSRFDSSGWISSEREDADFDGDPDTWISYRQSVQESMERDVNGNGQADAWTRFDRHGLISSEELDANFDGTPDIWYRYRASQLTEARQDTDFDGEADVTVRYRYFYPTEAVWEPRPGAPGRKVVYRHGQRHEVLRDLDGDGRYDQRILLDPFEQPVEKTDLR